MQARTHLESLFADGKLEQTINLYTQLSRQYNDSERLQKGMLESNRYSNLMEQHLQNTISQADYHLEHARISRLVLKFITELPPNWKYPYEPLPEGDHSPTTLPQKSFLGRWGLILGVFVSLAGILGVTLKDVFFSKKEEVTTQPTQQQNPQPSTTEVVPNTSTLPSKSQPTAPTPGATQQRRSPQSSVPNTTVPTHSEPVHPSSGTTTLATPDRKFRSYAKPLVSNDMEKGFILEGNKVAYRNLKTKAVLCCFEDGEMFENGKAKVSENGRDYYFVDKNGKKIQ